MRTSHGCFRMYNGDVTQLFSMIPVGTPVRIINEPYKFGRSEGKIYLEAHAPIDDKGDPSIVDKHTAVINALLKREDIANQMQMDWNVVREVVAAEDGLPVAIAQPQQMQNSPVAATADQTAVQMP
ncbi:putative L,D-transpeptidase YbiS [compost metagenome]